LLRSYDDIVFNNYLDNIVNLEGGSGNQYNTTKTPGTNIIGGPFIGGNYWSGYTGVDLDGDGLVDTMIPHNSSGNIEGDRGDYHPLVIPLDLVLIPIEDQEMYENASLNITVLASASNTSTIVLSVSGLPGFGAFTDQGNGIGIISFTPGYDDAGNYTILVNATNDEVTVSDDFILTVKNANYPPVAENQVVITDENIPVDIILVANDADDDPLAFNVLSQPTHGILTGNAPNLTYTPDFSYSGFDNFTFMAFDGFVDSNIATVSIIINPSINHAPVALNDSYNISEDSILTVSALGGILDNDFDVDNDSLTAILVTNASNGTINLNDNGSFTYVPDVNYGGVDNFTYVTNDGSLDSNIAIVNITVGPVNDAPILTPVDDQVLHENSTLNIPVSASDPDGDMLTLSVYNLPFFAEFIDYGNGTGLIMFSPGFEDAGFYQLTVSVGDGSVSASDDFNLTVNNLNLPPNIPGNPYPPDGAININSDINLSWTCDDPDPDDTLTYEIYFGSSPLPQKVTDNQSATTYDPGILNFETTYYWKIIAWDAHDAHSEGPIWSFITGGSNEPPVANAGPNQTVEQTSSDGAEVTLNGSGSYDLDGDSLDYDWTWPGGSAQEMSPTVTFPSGTTIVTLTVSDGNLTDSDTVNITVEDTTPPAIILSDDEIVLWPPNHKYHTIEISDFVESVTDICDPDVDINDLNITSVSSDEPENAQGGGDGNTWDDIVIVDSQTVKLRAERQGSGNGRVYTINFEVTDTSDNTAIGYFQISVPHDKKSTAIDDGPEAGYIVYY